MGRFMEALYPKTHNKLAHAAQSLGSNKNHTIYPGNNINKKRDPGSHSIQLHTTYPPTNAKLPTRQPNNPVSANPSPTVSITKLNWQTPQYAQPIEHEHALSVRRWRGAVPAVLVSVGWGTLWRWRRRSSPRKLNLNISDVRWWGRRITAVRGRWALGRWWRGNCQCIPEREFGQVGGSERCSQHQAAAEEKKEG